MAARETRPLRLSVSLANAAGGLEVRVAPGHETALAFEMPLARDGVELGGGRERLKRLDVTERRITLEPATELTPGERLLLTVRFADGRVPERAVLALVPGPVAVDAQVTVTRQPSTQGEFLSELDATRAQLEEARQQFQAQRHRSVRNGLFDLVLEGGGRGLPLHHSDVSQPPDKRFGVEAITLSVHRAPGVVFLAVGFRPTSEVTLTEPWTLNEVVLRHLGTSFRPRVLSIEMRPPRFKVGERVLVLIEFESLVLEPGNVFSLQCGGRSGQPLLQWEEVLL